MNSSRFVRSFANKVPFFLCVVLLLVAGCSSGGKVDGLVEVTGQVTLDGKPVPGGIVAFRPDPSKGVSGPMSCGSIDENGQYLVKTAGQKGVPAGWYVVTIDASSQGMLTGEGGKPVVIPKKYTRLDATPLKAEVKPGEKAVIDLKLESGA